MPLDDGNPLHEAWMEEQRQLAMRNPIQYDFSTYVQQQQAAIQRQHEAWMAGLAGRLQEISAEMDSQPPEERFRLAQRILDLGLITPGEIRDIVDPPPAVPPPADEPDLTLWDHLMADD